MQRNVIRLAPADPPAEPAPRPTPRRVPRSRKDRTPPRASPARAPAAPLPRPRGPGRPGPASCREVPRPRVPDFSHLPACMLAFSCGMERAIDSIKRQSVFGHAGRIAARRIHHQDAAPRGCVQIDVVHAHARASDHAQLAARGSAVHRSRASRCARPAHRPRRAPRASAAAVGCTTCQPGSASSLTPCSLMRSATIIFMAQERTGHAFRCQTPDSRLPAPAKPCEINIGLRRVCYSCRFAKRVAKQHPWRSSTAFKKTSPKP